MIKKQLLILVLFISVLNYSQNKKIIFGFDDLPQSLLINPGSEFDAQWHIGVPLLSGIYAHGGVSGFALADVFLNDGVDVNTKLNLVLAKMTNQDFYTANQQMEVFNVGFRLQNKKDYLSFGFYQEFDGILYHPKQLIDLAQTGNQNFEQIFNLNDLKFRVEMIGVTHVGLTRKVNDKLTFGARAKLYSSVFNFNSVRNEGRLVSRLGDDNIYNSRLQGIDFELNTSGVVHNGDAVLDEGLNVGKFIASGNMGFGLDFGLTYAINDAWKIAGSFQDLGFIRHTKNTTTYRINGTQEFEGLNLLFPTDHTNDYLQEVKNELPLIEGSKKYTTWRPLKINGSLRYQFGADRDNSCLRTHYENSKKNEVGLQLYTVFRPRRPQGAATIYYSRRFAKFLKTKITYTVDEYSAANFGFGLSTQIGVFNMYGAVDNILGLTDLSKSKSQTLSFGMNIIMDYNKSKP